MWNPNGLFEKRNFNLLFVLQCLKPGGFWMLIQLSQRFPRISISDHSVSVWSALCISDVYVNETTISSNNILLIKRIYIMFLSVIFSRVFPEGKYIEILLLVDLLSIPLSTGDLSLRIMRKFHKPPSNHRDKAPTTHTVSGQCEHKTDINAIKKL